MSLLPYHFALMQTILIDSTLIHFFQEYNQDEVGTKNHLDKYCGCRNIAAASLGLNINIQNTKIKTKLDRDKGIISFFIFEQFSVPIK